MPGVAGAEEPGLLPMKTTHADAVKDMIGVTDVLTEMCCVACLRYSTLQP